MRAAAARSPLRDALVAWALVAMLAAQWSGLQHRVLHAHAHQQVPGRDAAAAVGKGDAPCVGDEAQARGAVAHARWAFAYPPDAVRGLCAAYSGPGADHPRDHDHDHGHGHGGEATHHCAAFDAVTLVLATLPPAGGWTGPSCRAVPPAERAPSAHRAATSVGYLSRAPPGA